ncbi:MAG TPA: DUF932 domain-containing protein [Fimbriimonas sp.]|nr:DUF932 domain-containing protein [Fimbriimonas sp.]
MAHEVAVTDGRVAIAYFGQAPWHGLGRRLDNPATAQEAITAAGLDYEVSLKPMFTAEGMEVPKRRAVVREDTRVVLGGVGPDYVPIQNTEAFEFLDAIVAEGGLRYHTAGALGKGERLWLLAKLPGYVRVKGTEDVTDKYLLLSNSHNGTSALRVFFTPIRVVCANTLAIAHGRGVGQGISIVHKGGLRAKVAEAQKMLGLAHRFYDDLEGQINRLASYYPTLAQLKHYFAALYPEPDNGNGIRTRNIHEELFRLFELGRGQDIYGIRRTAWAAYHAITEYVDHHRPTRAAAPQDRSALRLQSQWFGSGAKLKAKPWDDALLLVSS